MPRVFSEQASPVEILRAPFDSRRHVAQPQRAVSAVSQEVKTQQPRVVFLAQDAHGRARDLQALRAFVSVFRAPVEQLPETPVQVNPERAPFGARQNLLRLLVLLRPHAKVYVARGPQALLGVSAPGGPPFNQHRVNSLRVEE